MLRKMFKKFDKDGDNQLNVSELGVSQLLLFSLNIKCIIIIFICIYILQV